MTDRIVAGIVAKLYGDDEPSLAELEADRAAIEARIEQRRRDDRLEQEVESDGLFQAVLREMARRGYAMAESERKNVRDLTINDPRVNTTVVIRFFPWDYVDALEVRAGAQVITFARLPSEDLLMAVLSRVVTGTAR